MRPDMNIDNADSSGQLAELYAFIILPSDAS